MVVRPKASTAMRPSRLRRRKAVCRASSRYFISTRFMTLMGFAAQFSMFLSSFLKRKPAHAGLISLA